LNNGQVLIVGGESGISTLPCPTSSPAPVGNGYQLVPFAHTGGTILYNPTSDSFAQSAGPGRLIHSATLLQDGRVLISGGAHDSACPGDFTINTAFLYDATGASFAATGNLNAARGAHTATLLHNGLVLVAGGVDPNGFILNTAELYDPTTAQFVPTSKMTHERAAHTAVLLTSGALAGKVLMAGGLTNGGSEDTAELYDPNTGMFTSTGKLIVGRFNHVAVLLPDGKVLIAGGQVSSGSANSAERYDPATGTFAATGNMRDQRAAYTATLLP
jgi:hypothetical protein